MRLYNSLSRQIERFLPRAGNPVTVYVCGITPYDTTHLGHAATYTVFDVLLRHMDVVHGWPVRYVQNVTDVDDDILRRAAETGEDWRALCERWTARFTADMAALGLRAPDEYPGATAYVPEVQAYVASLLRAGAAYERGGSVYFRAGRAPDLGQLADPGTDLLAVANERGNDPGDPNKDDPLDFVLWQAGRPGEPAWDSPWGPGRPGWHIECSAIARALLGLPVDIHGGGQDLAFPHHGCEMAQCQALGGPDPCVRVWVHVAMVHKDGRKMSKSLGNLVMVSDLLAATEPDALRLYVLRHHYRTAWEWAPEELEECRAWARALHAAARRRDGTGVELDPALFGPRFVAAVDNDLDTPTAIAVVLDLADAVLEAPANARVAAAQDVLFTLAGRVLGLWLRPYAEVGAAEREAAAWPEPRWRPPDRMLPD
jgi:L-cysteine:1D-myo-inositol 2-amino-2-deoxy-alpha-D-glucopyranoside ligase